MAEAALQELEKTGKDVEADFAALYEDLKEHYRRRLSSLPQDDGTADGAYEKFVTVSLDLLRIERETAVKLRNSGRISDEVLRQLLQELDSSETRHRLPS
jgi:CPA1 family monovalent cation:H+ antiporter